MKSEGHTEGKQFAGQECPFKAFFIERKRFHVLFGRGNERDRSRRFRKRHADRVFRGKKIEEADEYINEAAFQTMRDEWGINLVRLAVYAKNINASLPLEKQRYSITFIRDSVLNQINEYLRNLGEEKKFAVISNMLEKTKYALAGKKVIAKVVNLDSKKAEQLLKKENTFELVKCESSDSRIIEDEKLEGLEVREGIVLCAEDNSVTVRLTFDEKVKQILDEKNLELSTALFGRRIPE